MFDGIDDDALLSVRIDDLQVSADSVTDLRVTTNDANKVRGVKDNNMASLTIYVLCYVLYYSPYLVISLRWRRYVIILTDIQEPIDRYKTVCWVDLA